MPAADYRPDDEPIPDEDHFVLLRDVSWSDYLRIMRERGEHSAPRIAYLEGQLEIMSPGISHERIHWLIGHLVAEWCLARGIEFGAFGSWTVKDKRVARGVEPDECFVVGPAAAKTPKRPDLAVEVIWTSSSINKLEIYRKLRVGEVWTWRSGTLTPYVLRGVSYEPAAESRCLPGIDLRQIASLLDQPTASAAIRAYRDLLRNG